MATPTIIELDTIQVGSQAVWFCATLLLVVYFGLNRRWLKNIWAKMFVSLDVALWFLDLPNCLHQWFGLSVQNDFFAWYDAVTVWGVALTILWRAGMIVYIQLTRERREAEWEIEDGEISQGHLEGAGSESGDWGNGEPPALRSSHPGGN